MGGYLVNDKILESRFYQVANQIDKENKLINLVGYDNEDEDEEMKEDVKDTVKAEENNNQNIANNEFIPNINNNINENNSNLNNLNENNNINSSSENRNDAEYLNIDRDSINYMVKRKNIL